MADSAWALGQLLAGERVTIPPLSPNYLRLEDKGLVDARGRSAGSHFMRGLKRTDWSTVATTTLTGEQARLALRDGRTIRHAGMPSGTGLRELSDGKVIVARDGDAQTRPYQLDLDEWDRTDWTEVQLAPPPPEGA